MLLGALLVGSALLADVPDAAARPSAAILKAYDEEAAKAGKDADSQIRLALWCEVNGLQAERTKHLALAVLRDPTNTLARGLLGLVDYQGRWQRPDAVTEKLKADPERTAAIRQYLDKRARTPDKADDQWKLAAWCEQNGLIAESKAHFRAVVRLDPTREAAWKRLGYENAGGRWVTADQLAAEKQDAEIQKHADKHWKPALEGYRASLDAKSPARREAVEAALLAVTDPRAVPSIWTVFASSKDETKQAVAVRLFGQIDEASASRRLAFLAVASPSAEVRRVATETLKRRDAREFADLLIALIREPIKYEVKPAGSQNSSSSLSIKGKDVNVKRIYTPPQVQMPTLLPGDQIGHDASGLPVIYRQVTSGEYLAQAPMLYANGLGGNSSEYFKEFTALFSSQSRPAAEAFFQSPHKSAQNSSRQGSTGNFAFATDHILIQISLSQLMANVQNANSAARQKLETDIDQLEAYNRLVALSNARVLPVLAGVAGCDFGPDLMAWQKWWNDVRGDSLMPQKTQDSTTIVEQVPIDFQAAPINPISIDGNATTFRKHSCFAAGTSVKTIDGLRPIESLEVGDLVLTQDVSKTGALRYQPVLTVYHNPPNPTFRITLEGESIVSSAIHRFWMPGRGWVMARDLKTGDILRTIGGVVRVTAVEDERGQPVFNIDVAEDANFFVGQTGTLAHDMSLPDLRLIPFDAPSKSALARAGE